MSMKPDVRWTESPVFIETQQGTTEMIHDDVIGAGIASHFKQLDDQDLNQQQREEAAAGVSKAIENATGLDMPINSRNDPEMIQDIVTLGEPGYIGRLSMPGYMDSTDWTGPEDTAVEIIERLHDVYGPDQDVADMDENDAQVWSEAYESAESEDAKNGATPATAAPSM